MFSRGSFISLFNVRRSQIVRSKNLFAQIECVKCTEYDFVGPLTHQPLEIVMMIAQTVVNMIEKTIGMRYSSKSLKMNRNEKKLLVLLN